MHNQAFERLQNDLNGFMRTSVLAAMAELDIATLILEHGNSLTATEIASLRGCDERAMSTLLDCLSALGYLCKQGLEKSARYSVAEAFTDALHSGHPASYIAMIRHMACVQRSWTRLSWAVRDGEPQEGGPSILGAEEDRVSFIMGMDSIANRLKDSVLHSLDKAGVLPNDGEDIRIIDVGGASGTYTQAFLEKLPGAYATIFDLPVGIAQARKRFTGSDMEERVTLIEGDFTKDAFPQGFDLAWVSAIIHQMGREESRALYAKVKEALVPGGIIAIRDFVMDESRTSPVAGALFGINMLVKTRNGMVYSRKDIQEDLEQSGFIDVCHAVDVPTMGAVMTARKAI